MTMNMPKIPIALKLLAFLYRFSIFLALLSATSKSGHKNLSDTKMFIQNSGSK